MEFESHLKFEELVAVVRESGAFSRNLLLFAFLVTRNHALQKVCLRLLRMHFHNIAHEITVELGYLNLIATCQMQSLHFLLLQKE